MSSEPFVPTGFAAPRSLITDRFVLEPLGPQHNEADHAAWSSSIEHIRGTTGFTGGSWPPIDGMSLEANLDDLNRHAADFESGVGFTFTVLDPGDGDVIGCVYLYPTKNDADVSVLSWVRADRSELDEPLADAVAAWLADDWPWQQPDRRGR
jgi:RimJ/RimL family protein N-acetyltransferase